MLLTTTRVTDSAPCPAAGPGLMDTRTSTRVPGTTKPATPITSLTLTDRARIPGGIVGGKPAPAPAGASLDSVNGSFSDTDWTRPRLATCSRVAKEPGMGLAAGHGTTLTSSGFRRLPIGSGFEATT